MDHILRSMSPLQFVDHTSFHSLRVPQLSASHRTGTILPTLLMLRVPYVKGWRQAFWISVCIPCGQKSGLAQNRDLLN